MNRDSYRFYDADIMYYNNTVTAKNWFHFKYPHYGTLHRVFNMLRKEGFTIENDVNVAKCIRSNHFTGRCGDLEFVADRYPRGFKIQFFQNIVFENRNGGRFDYDRFQKMPYMIRLQFLNYRNKIVSFLNDLEDLKDDTDPKPRFAEEWIKVRYTEEWFHEQNNTDFKLSDLDGQTQPDYNGTGRDGEMLHNGDVKYFRGMDGYLCRGRIYHNINNMWWVIVDKYTVRNVADFELFDLRPEDNRHRQKKPVVPAAFEARRKAIKESGTKELFAELRRRGIKIKERK